MARVLKRAGKASLLSRVQISELFSRLRELNPKPVTELEYSTPFELLVAVTLSAQATDVGVNKATRRLFPVANTPQAILDLGEDGLKRYINTIGLYNAKAANVVAACRILVEKHNSVVPQTREELEALPGVGRKTANVVLGNVFAIPGMVVDTHVKRLAGRFGWTRESDPVRIEKDLCQLLPEERWTQTSHVLILHGRALCKAPIPHCSLCPVLDLCPRQGITRSH